MSGGHNAERKLATDAAKQTATEMISLISEELIPLLDKFELKAAFLDDPQNFDGPIAIQYDSEHYPATQAAIDKLQTELGDLSSWLDKNLQNILTAGGG